jgi:hypothetical protein
MLQLPFKADFVLVDCFSVKLKLMEPDPWTLSTIVPTQEPEISGGGGGGTFLAATVSCDSLSPQPACALAVEETKAILANATNVTPQAQVDELEIVFIWISFAAPGTRYGAELTAGPPILTVTSASYTAALPTESSLKSMIVVSLLPGFGN